MSEPHPLHVQLISRFQEATTTDDYEIFDEIMVEDYRQIDSMIPDGRDMVKIFFEETADALSDKRAEIVDIISDGEDRFCVRQRLHGRHTGHFFGLEPTGKELTMESVDWFTVRDGKLASHFGMSNPLPWLAQIGVIEPGWPFDGAPMPQ
jgi:steroid delta-isomerase-like uncharacterized protein